MNLLRWLVGKGKGILIIIPLWLLMTPLFAHLAYAEGRLAISGSFSNQVFDVPQGSSLSASSVYVVVFNQGDTEFRVRMTYQAPAGVKVILSKGEFLLKPTEQQNVLIGIDVSKDAVPGEYTIGVNAESYISTASGIKLMGAAGQSAKLVVRGESGMIKIQVVSPDKRPVAAVVRLFKVKDQQNNEIAGSNTGALEAKVSPGSFIASAFLAGNKLGEESFQVAANEEKAIALTVRTVYFESFGVVPHFIENKNLSAAEVVYTLNNLYQSFPKAEVALEVKHEQAPVDKVILATLTPLDKGKLNLRYNYTPSGGWKPGTYSLRLQLNVGGEQYAITSEEKLNIDGVATAGWSFASIPSPFIGVAAGVVVLIIAWYVRRIRS